MTEWATRTRCRSAEFQRATLRLGGFDIVQVARYKRRAVSDETKDSASVMRHATIRVAYVYLDCRQENFHA